MREKIRQNKLLAMAAIFLIMIIAIVAYRAVNNMGGKEKTKTNPQVSVMELKRGDMMRHIVLSGQTIADATVVLAPKYAGKVTSVNVQLGDKVKEGQILLVQDTGDLDIAIAQGQAAAEASGADATTEQASYYANYLKTEAAYDIEKKHYERQQYLYSIGAISQDTLDNARNQYVTAKAAFDSLENQNDGSVPASVRSKQLNAAKNKYAVEALQKQRNDMIIRAPRDGIIGYRDVEVGSYLSPGSKVLTLVDNSHVYVDCALSENDAAILEAGMPVQVTIDAMGQTYSGKLVYVSPAMTSDSKTFTARISLDVSKSAVKAGLFAKTAIDIMQRKDTLCVPKEAIMSKNGETKVYVYDPETKTVEERVVTIGLLNDEEAEILSGVKEGDIIVTSNQDRLQNGMTVTLKDEDGKAGA
ncbi:MAG: efflux RND transporter periplasmic adaptor subunit [Anaerovibrio sp.]|nr:efflux RND transporter periplasmic adaptor subunit [Anaerovibrio sp.]